MGNVLLRFVHRLGPEWIVGALLIAAACGNAESDDSATGGTGGTGGAADGGGGTSGAQCTGTCMPGDTCTIDPPPGSDAPSILCRCEPSRTWCCANQTCWEGTGGAAGSGGSPASGGSAGAAASSGSGGGPGCVDCDLSGLVCCNDRCVNVHNDIHNCGGCGVECTGPNPYCDDGTCGMPPCSGAVCSGSTSCCGSECCGMGQLCCTVNLGPTVTSCHEPEGGTCPVGCPTCVCAAPGTPIATPSGNIPIASIRTGDLVYSVEADAIVVVPVLRTNRARVDGHRMVRVTLASGETIEMSPAHPTADGRTFGELGSGAKLGQQSVARVELVPYEHGHTYDILPGSATGAYFAAGALVGSTLADPQ